MPWASKAGIGGGHRWGALRGPCGGAFSAIRLWCEPDNFVWLLLVRTSDHHSSPLQGRQRGLLIRDQVLSSREGLTTYVLPRGPVYLRSVAGARLCWYCGGCWHRRCWAPVQCLRAGQSGRACLPAYVLPWRLSPVSMAGNEPPTRVAGKRSEEIISAVPLGGGHSRCDNSRPT